jgi:hypothetical protein
LKLSWRTPTTDGRAASSATSNASTPPASVASNSATRWPCSRSTAAANIVASGAYGFMRAACFGSSRRKYE